MSLRGGTTKQSHRSMAALYSMRLPRRTQAHSHFAPRNDIFYNILKLFTYSPPSTHS
jgi:hypothetical protein